jgi:hypothetical protein
MKYKGIEYKVLQTTTPGVWAWSFGPPKAIPTLGKTRGSRPVAIAAVHRAINTWLKDSTDDQAD